MSKAIINSISPHLCEKIASKKCSIIVRKTRPKLETPFKCYIYCTKGIELWGDGSGETWRGIDKDEDLQQVFELNPTLTKYNGKVIGEFICDRIIYSQAYFDSQGKNHLTNVFPEDIKRTCLTEYEVWDYIAGKAVKANEMYDGYLWHISTLKIYDKPKELSEFSRMCDGVCCNTAKKILCLKAKTLKKFCCDSRILLTRPPQSWCYVEVDE